MIGNILKYSFLFIIFVSATVTINAQQAFRIEAGISIKEKHPDGREQLIVGDVFYDRNIDKVIYDIKFPEKEKWVIKDTVLFKLVNDRITETFPIPPISRLTFFNLILTGRIQNFGLNDSGFEIEKVEKLHTIGYNLKDAKVTLNQDIKINVAGVKIVDIDRAS